MGIHRLYLQHLFNVNILIAELTFSASLLAVGELSHLIVDLQFAGGILGDTTKILHKRPANQYAETPSA